MSFSSRIKEELSRHMSAARHCQIAEIAAILSLCGRIQISGDDHYSIKIHTENVTVARKCFTLLRKTFNIETDISIRRNAHLGKNRIYSVCVKQHEDALRVLKATKLLSEDGEIGENLSVVGNVVVQNPCCRRAFLRGAFLASGSISDPEKFYHFEIVCATEPKARQIQSIMATFDIDAKIVIRKRYYVVYIKEGSQIVDILNVMEAHLSLMELENIRILKEMRGNVNRQVNCETANINKTVSAAVKQIEDIEFIRDTVGFESLPDGLAQIARARLLKPEATLKELGEDLEPPVGKSGVNHRLRKLGEMAEKLRDQGTDSCMEIGYFHSFVQLRRIIMTKRTVTIELASGLEARPIAMLVQLASSYESTIYVQSDNKKINAKSIMGMMTLDLPVGEQVIVTADGVDEEKAVNDIEKYLSNN